MRCVTLDDDEQVPRSRHPRGGRLAALIVAGMIVIAAWLVPASAAEAGPAAPARSSRVLIVSFPTLTWDDVDPAVTPTLSRFLDQAAVADLATRADRQPANLGAAYVTIGAGARSAGDEATDGEGLEVGERFGTVSAGDVYRQRTAGAPGHGIVNLGSRYRGRELVAPLRRRARSARRHTHPARLHDGGRRERRRGAPGRVASEPAYARSAVGALMGEHGRLARGEVSRSLLEHDAAAPFGQRLDQHAVVDSFTRDWATKRSVALVEASDLVRADRAASLATANGATRLRHQALRWSDHLFAALLHTSISPRDTVLVVGPVPPSGSRSLTVAALRGPGIAPGLLRSATTRRSGFVTLADVAPTVLDQLGVAPPESMEGRRMLDDAGHGSAADRRALLEQANADGLLRDDLVNPVTATVLWIAIVVSVASALLLVVMPSFLRRRPWLGSRAAVGRARTHRLPARDHACHRAPFRGTQRQGGLLDVRHHVRRRVRRAVSSLGSARDGSTRCSGRSGRSWR